MAHFWYDGTSDPRSPGPFAPKLYPSQPQSLGSVKSSLGPLLDDGWTLGLHLLVPCCTHITHTPPPLVSSSAVYPRLCSFNRHPHPSVSPADAHPKTRRGDSAVRSRQCRQGPLGHTGLLKGGPPSSPPLWKSAVSCRPFLPVNVMRLPSALMTTSEGISPDLDVQPSPTSSATVTTAGGSKKVTGWRTTLVGVGRSWNPILSYAYVHTWSRCPTLPSPSRRTR